MNGESSTKSTKKSDFRRSVFVLVGGTAFGHVITALALPVATRLYSPAEFGVLAIFASLVSIVSVIACLRLDIAIPVGGTDKEAANLLVLALAFAFLISLAVGISVAILPGSLLDQIGLAAITPYLWLLPLGILLAGAYSAFQGWQIRRRGFGLIARSRVGQSAAMAGGQIGLGAAGVVPLGLLVGHTLNTAVGCLVLGYRAFANETRLFGAITRESLRATFHAFSTYPKYSTFEALCNSAAIQLPVIMIAALALGPEAGYLTLAMSVMQAPMALIGSAIGQVYLSQAPDEYRKGNLGQFTVDTLGGLSRVGIGPLVFAAIVAPEGFAIIFGESWRRAGEIVTWMTPWFVAQFLSSPLSMAVHVTGHQRAAMSLQVFGLVIRVAAVWCASSIANEFIVEVYALSGLVFYLGYFFTILIAVGASPSMVLKKLASNIFFTFVWVLFGFASLWVMKSFVNKLLSSVF